MPMSGKMPSAPGLLWLFGEEGYGKMWIWDGSEADIQKAQNLLPEAEIENAISLN